MKQEMEEELVSNILPFWINRMTDEVNGGFYGRITGREEVKPEAEKGAILNARIPRVFYGARDPAFGACGGVLNLFMEDFPHRPALVGGILGEECAALLQDFFQGLRSGGGARGGIS